MAHTKGQSRKAQEFYQKGLNALAKKNYDYAIEMLLQVVLENPLFTDARRELHNAEREKNKKNRPSLFAVVLKKINPTYIINFFLASLYEAQRNYAKAIAFYEELLKAELINKTFLKKIANNALKANWPEVAIVSLESLFEIDNEDADIANTLGELYRNHENVEKASFYFDKALQIKPHDQKISKSLKDLEALRSIQKGGWDKDGSYRSKIKDENTARTLEMESTHTHTSSLAQEKEKHLLETITGDAANENNWIKLIDFYLDIDNIPSAKKIALDAKNKFPHSELIDSREQHIKDKEIELKIQTLDNKIKQDPTNQELQEQKKKLYQERVQAEKITLEKKVSQYPNDLSLKFKLGSVYFLLADYDKAIVEFQQAVKDPALAVRALDKLGRSFHHKKMYDLALQQFNKALERVSGINETSKEIIYSLGTTLEAMGKDQEAIEQFKKIYEVDISYRDVGKKIEGFYKK